MKSDLKQAYLKQAVEADKKAVLASDEATAAMWKRIADSYRELAAEQDALYTSWM